MTIDTLLSDFDAAVARAQSLNREELPAWAHRRAGLVAIVRALRDELFPPYWQHRDFLPYEAEQVFKQILGDAGEKVAEGNFTIPSEGRVIAPATDPAPAVCVWTQQSLQAFYNSACGLDSMTHGNAVCKCQDTCPSCGKPITFTEGK